MCAETLSEGGCCWLLFSHSGLRLGRTVLSSPPPSRIIQGPAQSFDVRTFYADTHKCQEMLGYKAKTSLEDGLEVLRKKMIREEAPSLNRGTE